MTSEAAIGVGLFFLFCVAGLSLWALIGLAWSYLFGQASRLGDESDPHVAEIMRDLDKG